MPFVMFWLWFSAPPAQSTSIKGLVPRVVLLTGTFVGWDLVGGLWVVGSMPLEGSCHMTFEFLRGL